MTCLAEGKRTRRAAVWSGPLVGLACGLALCQAGCLIVDETGGGASETDGLFFIGEVHACAIKDDSASRHFTMCFASQDDITDWETQTIALCATNQTPCDARCDRWSLRPCFLACPDSGLPRGCNASDGCYCPDSGQPDG